MERLAEQYISQKCSIILAVMCANNDMTNQDMLDRVAKHDPTRERTLGILNKPNLVEVNSDKESAYVQLAKNENTTKKLKLGWHVLLNRSQAESNSPNEERDRKKTSFFRHSA